jgi:uncharacterized protein YceK
MKKIKLLIVLLLTLVLSSCATIMTGTSSPLSINSNVRDSKIYVDGVYSGNAPIMVNLKTKRDHVIKIEAEGYEPYMTVIKNKASGWVWGNLFFGGVVGLVIDFASGGLYVLEEDTITGNLYKTSVGTLKKDSSIN